MTISKAQGQFLEEVHTDFETNVSHIYVGCTKVCSAKGLQLPPTGKSTNSL
jgi:hypothetical protein